MFQGQYKDQDAHKMIVQIVKQLIEALIYIKIILIWRTTIIMIIEQAINTI